MCHFITSLHENLKKCSGVAFTVTRYGCPPCICTYSHQALYFAQIHFKVSSFYVTEQSMNIAICLEWT